ncbi:tetratricopeptide repeat protein [Pseudothioclava arenosa]|uniref:Ancillary SecYEG translocon subunit/Cell division coordinator CpoB TPR domain-containing protein n=1 Tax=Pseudothioclava arenosa TaxID=1795308 RepID=A0A2A4CT32_9RHOB|nr:tetratricopeptide repeat protein [Pseudothioclava arenosa]PCD77244.1 hypothetical protein CLN94_05650 [Pseudothioclava arenosa]
MSEIDSFIEEVTEEVRRDKLFALLKKYGWIGVVVILGIVGGAAYTEWSRTQAENAAQAFGDQLLAAVQAENSVAALGAIEASDANRAALTGLLLAGEAQSAGDSDAALAALKTVASDAALPPSLRELALLKSVIVAGAGMDPSERAAALADLARPGAPYRPLALEQQALLALEAGDREGAIGLLQQISGEAGITPGLQQRATELMVALGAEPAVQ